jgi:hypothetical protein
MRPTVAALSRSGSATRQCPDDARQTEPGDPGGVVREPAQKSGGPAAASEKPVPPPNPGRLSARRTASVTGPQLITGAAGWHPSLCRE